MYHRFTRQCCSLVFGWYWSGWQYY